MQKSKMRFPVALFVISMLTLSCGKEKIDEHPDFAGYWVHHGSDAIRQINIEVSGNATYREDNGFSYKESSGKFKVKNGDKVKIGVKGLSLDVYPHETDNDEWEMTLDGDVYTGK